MNPCSSALNVNDEVVRSKPYDQILPEMAALDPKAVTAVNIDVGAAVRAVLGCLPEIRDLRADILVHLPTFRISLVDQLEQYALALSWAHSLFVSATKAKDNLAAVAAEGVAWKEKLHADAMSLCGHGVLQLGAFKGYKAITGYLNVAADLQLLTSVLLLNWPSIDGKSPLRLDEVTRADKIATRMLRLAGLRDQAPKVIAECADSRNRAFTLFIQAYDAVRRAVTYLRWDTGDVDDFAPSLYIRRKRRAAKEQLVPPPEPTLHEEATVAPDQLPAAEPPAAPLDEPLTALKSPRKLSVPVPGSDPFMD